MSTARKLMVPGAMISPVPGAFVAAAEPGSLSGGLAEMAGGPGVGAGAVAAAGLLGTAPGPGGPALVPSGLAGAAPRVAGPGGTLAGLLGRRMRLVAAGEESAGAACSVPA